MRCTNGGFLKKFCFLAILIFTLNTIAFADQCSALPLKQAYQAEQILKDFTKKNSIAVIDRFCEACMDTMVKPIVIDSIKIKDFQVKGYKEILINDKKIDLAYIYLNGENLAEKIGCKVIGNSYFL